MIYSSPIEKDRSKESRYELLNKSEEQPRASPGN
jgi:hypothetical protein